MKMTLSRLPFAMLLAASAAACAADTTDKADTAGSEDDLTSLTARSRELQFAGYVYVDPSADDASIVREIKKQTQSAFGALRDASIGVNSRELKDVDPATFLKVPVEVVDPANPTAKQSLLKVSYTFTDQAVVPVTMATRTALPLGLLGKNYQSQSQRIFTECTSGDAHAKEFIGSIRYVFDPSRASCKKAMTAEQTQIHTDRAGLAEGQIPKSELNRLYIPMTVNLRPTVAMGQNKYPEYDWLYAGGVEPGKLVIGMVSGMMADWAAARSTRSTTMPATTCGTAASAIFSARARASSSSPSRA